jgi:hypothetical protein
MDVDIRNREVATSLVALLLGSAGNTEHSVVVRPVARGWSEEVVDDTLLAGKGGIDRRAHATSKVSRRNSYHFYSGIGVIYDWCSEFSDDAF